MDTIPSGVEDNIHNQLLLLDSQDYKTNDDGTYEIYVIPNTYDILIDKASYLDYIYVSREVKEGETIDLGYKALIVGDLNKDGIISGKDMALIQSQYGFTDTDSKFNTDYDFDEDLSIGGKEVAYVNNNYLKYREINK